MVLMFIVIKIGLVTILKQSFNRVECSLPVRKSRREVIKRNLIYYDMNKNLNNYYLPFK